MLFCNFDAGIHPTTISEAFQKASAKSVEILGSMATPLELSDREALLKSATTSLNSKVECLMLFVLFLCQLTCQSADIMSSLCGVGVRVRVNNFFSKTTRPRDMLFFLKDTLSIEDEKLFKACKSVCSSVC